MRHAGFGEAQVAAKPPRAVQGRGVVAAVVGDVHGRLDRSLRWHLGGEPYPLVKAAIRTKGGGGWRVVISEAPDERSGETNAAK